MNDWISIKDRLPNGTCLTYGAFDYAVGVWNGELDSDGVIGYFTDGDVNWPATHWMLLPEPPNQSCKK